ncbi:hypothetical protein LR48_Vigan346s001100 [Vigna angularis]|uniref:PGG domain-containing protein n=1 Tax=Phaseolus angularis TaxID=3914 RepID=A0A0L9TA07_PHAAN|nr:uncharacterized protein HKW66_Vig0167580 [Vigna angularis]KOM26929.1 hypothetical protein LR48_Vigan346s001100 [Vigna angularis]
MDGVSLPTSMVTRKGRHNWMEERRGSLMIVATVLATMSFQIAINPPGGVWQSTSHEEEGCKHNTTCHAGTSVLAFGDSNQRGKFEIFMLLCTISFTASLSTIILLICVASLRNKLIMWFLTILMFISLVCTAGAYAICIWMILYPLGEAVQLATSIYARFWGGFTVLLCVGFFCRLAFLFLKKCFR